MARLYRGSICVLAWVVLWVAAGASAWAQPTKVWEVGGFQAPESVRYDAERDLLYVSNVNGVPNEKDGNGYISKVSPDGSMIEEQWAIGLDAPKGMALAGDRLYVSDIDRLAAIDVESGKVVETYEASGAQFLNDVAADEQGRIFVSDMFADTIYLLQDGKLEPWVQDTQLESPNGLLAEPGRLLVASWGVREEGFTTKTAGHLKAVSFDEKEITSIGEGTPIGNLDGLESDGRGRYLVTDWIAGALYRIDPAAGPELLLDLASGSADIGVIRDQNLVIVPMMNDGKIEAYKLE